MQNLAQCEGNVVKITTQSGSQYPPPRIVTSHAGLRNFDPEYLPPTVPRLELLMEDFVCLTGEWRVPLYPLRINSPLTCAAQPCFVNTVYMCSCEVV